MPALLRFETVLPIGILALVILAVFLRRNGRGWGYCLARVIFGLYLLALVSFTLFPIPLAGTPESRTPAGTILARVNLIPLRFGGLFNLPRSAILRELGGNILLTVPFGLGLRFFANSRPRAVPWLAVLTGLSIEVCQLMVSLGVGAAYRSVDINDVFLNAGGVLLGHALYRLWMFFRAGGSRLRVGC